VFLRSPKYKAKDFSQTNSALGRQCGHLLAKYLFILKKIASACALNRIILKEKKST